MKIRSGFVSNSSSSSFICDVCGENQSGYDMCISDAEMWQCVNGHTFCESHKLMVEVEVQTDDEEYDEDDRYGAKVETCPICQFVALEETAALNYLIKSNGTTRTKLLAEIKENFKTYKDFVEFLKAKVE